MVMYCQCGARIARLTKKIGRLRRRLAQAHRRLNRMGRPAREELEERRRKVRLHEYKLKRAADAGFQTLARLAERRERKAWRLKEDAAEPRPSGTG
jgi:hypothetical protein